MKKSISGGEMKRLLFASELLDNPALLFADEPTTGLDSSMADSVVNLMRSLTSSGHTIICTIHQPSSEIFQKFDKVMFLAAGRLAYFGRPIDSVDLFNSFGYPCPANYNPADLIVDILSIEPNNEEECRERANKICDQFRDSSQGQELFRRIEGNRSREEDRPTSGKLRQMAPVSLQIWSLLKRDCLDNYRNPGLARAKIIQKTFMGVFVGLLYFQTQINRVGISNINGSIFYVVSELTYSTLFGILSFLPSEYPLLVREYHDSLYYLPSYYIARLLSYIPLFTLDGLLMLSISYWMTGLTPTFTRFLIAIGWF
jgi:energy-coupling factor transporter ATP-binding protein EcfA2